MAPEGLLMARHRYSRSGLLGPVTQTMLPARVVGVPQRGGDLIPTACPNCHDDGPGWTWTEWTGHCWMCGETFFRTAYEVGPPVSHRSGNPHPVPLA